MNTTRSACARPLVLVALLSSTVVSADDLEALKAPDARVEKVLDGFRFTEGPAWSPQGTLLFSDIPNERIVELKADGTGADFLTSSGRANGLMFDRSGRLYACQGGARRVVRIDGPDNKITVLADSYDGKKLNSPNDLALDAHDGLYFTDPRYGNQDGLEQPVMGVYYIAASGEVVRVVDDLEKPNGILVSPGGNHLYVANQPRGEIYRYRIDAPGKISEKKLIFTGDSDLDGGGPDGMAHDELGNIYATYKGIVVLTAGGEVIGRIPVPQRPANCAFGGAEGRTLFITARTSLYKVELKVRGMALPETVKTVKAGELTLRVPSGWTQQEPSSNMRAAQFVIPAAQGGSETGELVVYYFGRGGAGGARANVDRWIGQFESKERKAKFFTGKNPTGNYALVDVTGTFNKPVGPPRLGQSKAMPGARMLAVYQETPAGPYYLKFTGSQKTVTAAAANFRRSFGADPKSEKEVKAGDL